MHLITGILSTLAAAITVSAPGLSAATNQSTVDSSACGFSSIARFIESAPRDRFSVRNTSSGDWAVTTFNLDLSTSAGNLIFDVTASGAGVEVFQPFRAENGDATLSNQSNVDDGDQTIMLKFSAFAPGQQYQFSIDVDDQLSESELGQIRVSGGEITGATITLDIMNGNGEVQVVSGVFDATNQVLLGSDNC